jgi:hypothetical protein
VSHIRRADPDHLCTYPEYFKSVDITMGTSLGCIDTAYTSLPASLLTITSSTNVIHIPRSESPPLHLALQVMMESIERTISSPFPALSAKLFVWTSPAWRKSYSMLSTFFNEGIAQARTREKENLMAKQGESLATDADCVLDMIVQREVREGAERFGKGEMLDELMTYVM